MKTQFISRIALLVSMGLSALTFVLFFLVGLGEINAEGKNEPTMTNLLIGIVLVFFAALVILTIANFFLAVAKNKDKGLLRVLVAFATPVILMVICYFVCSGQEVPEAMAGKITSTDMALADACIYPIALLVIVSIVCTVLCATGLLSKSGTKQG